LDYFAVNGDSGLPISPFIHPPTDPCSAKIAEGRVAKLAQEMALLPQPYLMDPSKSVEQAVKEAVAALGEKISVRRFVRFALGEGIEKKESNLAAEVAAATGAKSA
jgi:elongation factor Ts